VRVDEHCRWRLPHEQEPERVDVEALGWGQIADPEPQVTEQVGPKPYGGSSFLYLAFKRYVSLSGTYRRVGTGTWSRGLFSRAPGVAL
jgi:hypothetical protein